MPIKSKKQEKFMQAVANNPKFAKKVGVSKAVADKFVGKNAHKTAKKTAKKNMKG